MSSPRLSSSSHMRMRASKYTGMDRAFLMYSRNFDREGVPMGGNKRVARDTLNNPM